MKRHDFMGSALPKRARQKNAKFKDTGGFVSDISSTNVTVTTSESGSSYSVPSFDGVEFDRMRRYGLVLTRWSLHDPSKYAKSWKVTPQTVVSASRVVSNRLFTNTFDGEDPTKDTINIKPYVNAFKSLAISKDLTTATLSLVGTKAFKQILDEIRGQSNLEEVVETLEAAEKALDQMVLNGLSKLDGLHSKQQYKQRWAIDAYRDIVHYLDHYSDVTQRQADQAISRKRNGKGSGVKPTNGKHGEPTKKRSNVIVRRAPELALDDWCTPYVAKYPLELPHTGKAGRRLIPTNEGKYPKAFYRLVTDPYRRIFQRKTRALGGVVVIDCSGSMGLSDEDIDQMLKVSAGCTVICYSSHLDEGAWDKNHGNIHLVAKNGRRMRGLPDFPGGNGVDLPALRYGYEHHRINGFSPVIWVSDGQVTGKGDICSDELADQTSKYIKKHKIPRVHNTKQAIKLLEKLQRGIKK